MFDTFWATGITNGTFKYLSFSFSGWLAASCAGAITGLVLLPGGGQVHVYIRSCLPYTLGPASQDRLDGMGFGALQLPTSGRALPLCVSVKIDLLLIYI